MEHYKTEYLDDARLTDKGRKQVIDRLTDDKFIAPHCDSGILHIPNTCEFCDMYPDWQIYRIICNIAFTGQDADKLTNEYMKEYKLPKEVVDLYRFLPDPASFRRPLDTIEAWAGNVHENEYSKEMRNTYWAEFDQIIK